MTDYSPGPSLTQVVGALRHELHQYGEMLALLEQQREAVLSRAANEVMKTVVAIHQQMAAIELSRKEREQGREALALELGCAARSPFALLVPLLPAKFAPAVEALLQENARVQERFRGRAVENHALLRQSVKSMQQFLDVLGPAGGLRKEKATVSPARFASAPGS